MSTEEIRKGLRNVHTRANTINIVAEEGTKMIDDILPLLQDRHEGVRWSTIRILSEIGDERAIAPLVKLLEQSKNVTDVANALRAITGQKLGDDFAEWRSWLMQDGDIRNNIGGDILSDEELIKTAIKDLPIVMSAGSDGYSLNITLPDGRKQQVWIDFTLKDQNDHLIVQLSTPCGNADPDKYEHVLKLNMSIAYGSIALASLGETLCFAVVDSYLRETVHPEDLAKSIMSLAQHGDSVEKLLSDEDKF